MVPVDIQQYENQATDFETGLNNLETEDIITLIQKLPDNERLIFTMYEIEGYKHSEIEKETKINRNTSKWLFVKAKKSLQFMINNSFNLKNHKNE
jgi:RNA polymerase sigma-70 factor (ECF subfamily)